MNTKIKDPLIISLEAYKNGQIHLDGVIEDIQMLMQSPAQSAPLATEGREVWVEVSVKEFKIEPLKSVVVKFRNGLLRTGYFDILGNFRYDMAGANCLVKDGTAEMNQLLVFSRTTLPSQLEGNTLKQEGEQWVWVRASERMPELYPVNNTEQLHFELDGRKVDGYFLHSRCFEYFNNEIAGYSQIDFDDFARIEWLERHPSQPLGGYTLQQVRDYTVWIRENWEVWSNGLWHRKSDVRDRRTDTNLFKEYLGFTKFAPYDAATLTAPIPAEREGKVTDFAEWLQWEGWSRILVEGRHNWIHTTGNIQTTTELYQRYKQYLLTLK